MQSGGHSVAHSILLHATTVDFDGKGVLILGASGSGKSSLALQLVSLGAQLVSDDGTYVKDTGDGYMASAPEPIEGLIEARGIGILKVPHVTTTRLALAVDMGRAETERLPPLRHFRHGFVSLPCLYRVDSGYFPAGILRVLAGARQEN